MNSRLIALLSVLVFVFAIPGAQSLLYGAVLTALLVESFSGVLIFAMAGQVCRGENGK